MPLFYSVKNSAKILSGPDGLSFSGALGPLLFVGWVLLLFGVFYQEEEMGLVLQPHDGSRSFPSPSLFSSTPIRSAEVSEGILRENPKKMEAGDETKLIPSSLTDCFIILRSLLSRAFKAGDGFWKFSTPPKGSLL